MSPNLSRRDIFKLTAFALTKVVISSGCRGYSQHPESPETVPLPNPEFPPNQYLVLDPSSIKEPNLKNYGLEYFPDGHSTLLKPGDDNTHFLFVSANRGSYRLTIDPSGNYTSSVACLSRDPSTTYKNGYQAVTSVLPYHIGNQKVYIATTHCERWKNEDNGSGFNASIGLAISTDNGTSFIDRGTLIRGRENLDPGTEVTGAGQPCAIIRQLDGVDYLYTYYTEWLSAKTKQKNNTPDQIYLARYCLDNTKNKTLEYWNGNVFSPNQNDLSPVITPPQKDSAYSALAGISWNTKKQCFLATFETDTGVYLTQSPDGVHFSNPEAICIYPNPLSQVWAKGLTSYSYPTLVSFGDSTGQTTSDQVRLLLAKNIGPGSPHRLITIDGKII